MKNPGRIFTSPLARALAALLVVIALGAAFNGHGAFFKWSTHSATLRQVSVYGMLACGMTLVIITGGIDLAVGSVLGLTAVLFAQLSIPLHWGATGAVLCSLLAGIAAGAVSGALVSRFRVQPFIATLAMMVFARGLAKQVSGGQKISPSLPDGTYYMPEIFGKIDCRVFGNTLTVVTLVFLGCMLLSWIVLAWTRWGRYMYAIGGNEEAARLSGVPVRAAKMLAYSMSGLFAAVAGICQAAQEQQGDPETGSGYELSAIAMVVIGGTSLNGGRGSIWLTLVGVITIGYLEKILSINNVSEAGRLMLTGVIIVCAVLFQRRRR